MTTMLPAAALDAPLTTAALAQVLEEFQMRLLVQNEDVLVAERAIPGEQCVMRRVVAQRTPAGSWRVAHVFRLAPHHHELTHRTTVRDPLELGAFVGGVLSVPFSRAEVAAIEQGVTPTGARPVTATAKRTEQPSTPERAGETAEIAAVRYFLELIRRNVDEIAKREGPQNLYRLGALGELRGLAAGIGGYWPEVATEAKAISQRAKLAMDRE